MRFKLGDICCAGVWLAQLVTEFLTGLAVWRLNMLPDRYFAALAAVLAVLWLAVGLFLFLPGKKGKKGAFQKGDRTPGLFRRVLACVLSLAISVGCIGARSVVTEVHTTVDGITGAAETVSVSMSVYVLTEDPAGVITDAAGYTFAAMEGYEAHRTQMLSAQIAEELGEDISLRGYGTLTELVNGLYEGEVNAIILNSAYVTLLEETEEFADFSEKTRILYAALLEEEIPSTEPASTEEASPAETDPTQEPEKPFSITTDPFIMYISGSDTRDYYLATSRSDVNILMVVNPQTKQVLLVNTPRDYFVANPAGGGVKDKLTHCGIYGISCSMEALGWLYDVPVRYYAQINFTGMEMLVDAIGGVDVYSEYGFYALEVHWIDQGWNHLNGLEARAFAQDRYSHAGGDNARGRNQMKVIQAVINKATTGTTIITNYAAILESIQGMFKTNVTTEEIGELVKMQLEDMAQWNVLSYAVTGTGGSDITYSMPGLFCYVMYPDEDAVAYGSELINRVLDGQLLTEADLVRPN